MNPQRLIELFKIPWTHRSKNEKSLSFLRVWEYDVSHDKVNKVWQGTLIGRRTRKSTHQQLVVHCLDNDLLRRVLGNIESKLQHFAVTFILDEWTVQAIEPGWIVLRTQGTAVLRRALRRRAERYNATSLRLITDRTRFASFLCNFYHGTIVHVWTVDK